MCSKYDMFPDINKHGIEGTAHIVIESYKPTYHLRHTIRRPHLNLNNSLAKVLGCMAVYHQHRPVF